MGVNLLSQTVGEDSLQNRVNTRPRGFPPLSDPALQGPPIGRIVVLRDFKHLLLKGNLIIATLLDR